MEEEGCVVQIIVGLIAATCACALIYFISVFNKPTAMDVYQGKTTLEITYKNGIPIDSTVVFKK